MTVNVFVGGPQEMRFYTKISQMLPESDISFDYKQMHISSCYIR